MAPRSPPRAEPQDYFARVIDGKFVAKKIDAGEYFTLPPSTEPPPGDFVTNSLKRVRTAMAMDRDTSGGYVFHFPGDYEAPNDIAKAADKSYLTASFSQYVDRHGALTLPPQCRSTSAVVNRLLEPWRQAFFPDKLLLVYKNRDGELSFRAFGPAGLSLGSFRESSHQKPHWIIAVASWCRHCQRLKKSPYFRSFVQEAVRRRRCTVVDFGDTSDERLRALLRVLAVKAFPSSVVVRANGEIKPFRLSWTAYDPEEVDRNLKNAFS